jgi:hypothetical protein
MSGTRKILPTAVRVAKWGACLGMACGVLYSVGGSANARSES